VFSVRAAKEGFAFETIFGMKRLAAYLSDSAQGKRKKTRELAAAKLRETKKPARCRRDETKPTFT
jgi:hypothetical protein